PSGSFVTLNWGVVMLRPAAILGLLLIAGVVGVLCYGNSAGTSKSDEVTQFVGKYLMIHQKAELEEGRVWLPITGTEVTALHGHAFLIGKILGPTKSWNELEGKTIWVS